MGDLSVVQLYLLAGMARLETKRMAMYNFEVGGMLNLPGFGCCGCFEVLTCSNTVHIAWWGSFTLMIDALSLCG